MQELAENKITNILPEMPWHTLKQVGVFQKNLGIKGSSITVWAVPITPDLEAQISAYSSTLNITPENRSEAIAELEEKFKQNTTQDEIDF